MKYAIILGNLGNTNDRFLSSGYKDQPTKEEMIKRAAAIEGVEGVELVGTWDITAENVEQVGEPAGQVQPEVRLDHPRPLRPEALGQRGLQLQGPRHPGAGGGGDREDGRGGREAGLRPDQPLARAGRLRLPPPGRLPPGAAVDRGGRCAAWPAPTRKSASPWSTSPRSRAPTPTWPAAGTPCCMAQRVGMPNVGVTIDTGHSFVAGENVAEAAVMLATYGREALPPALQRQLPLLGRRHDRRAPCTSSEYVELLFWLREIGYTGWYSMDQYPYREEAQGALRECIEFLKAIERLLDEKSMGEIRELVKRGDAVQSTRWLRKRFLS